MTIFSLTSKVDVFGLYSIFGILVFKYGGGVIIWTCPLNSLETKKENYLKVTSLTEWSKNVEKSAESLS